MAEYFEFFMPTVPSLKFRKRSNRRLYASAKVIILLLTEFILC